MSFQSVFLSLLLHIGYLGPFVMGVADSSFLVLPFGNDLLVVGLIARHHEGAAWYVLSAACGSSVGALLLALLARKIGEEGIRKIAGERRYKKLKDHIGRHSGAAVAVAGLAPPPFPFTTVIAAVAALGYPIWRILVINFIARGTRFAIIALLAVRYGQAVIGIAKSTPFEWSMAVFIVLCAIASGFSIWQWMRRRS